MESNAGVRRARTWTIFSLKTTHLETAIIFTPLVSVEFAFIIAETSPSPGNTIFNIRQGLQEIAGIYLGGDVHHGSIERNRIHGLQCLFAQDRAPIGMKVSGIELYNADSVTIANNLIYDLLTVGDSSIFWSVGLRFDPASHVNVWYNSINMTGTEPGGYVVPGTIIDSALVSACMYIGWSTNSLDVRNNIFLNTVDHVYGPSITYGIYADDSSLGSGAFTYLDNNCYYALATGRVFGNNCDLPLWKSITGKDFLSISANPLYNSVDNLVPMPGSPVISAGTPVAVADDFDGNTRSATTPFIGAYENARDALGPHIVITPGSIPSGSSTVALTNFAMITDFSGVDSLTHKPRIYYRRSTDSNAYMAIRQPTKVGSGRKPPPLVPAFTALQLIFHCCIHLRDRFP